MIPSVTQRRAGQFKEHIVQRRLPGGKMPDIRAIGFQQRQHVKKIVIAPTATYRQLMTVLIGAHHTWQRT